MFTRPIPWVAAAAAIVLSLFVMLSARTRETAAPGSDRLRTNEVVLTSTPLPYQMLVTPTLDPTMIETLNAIQTAAGFNVDAIGTEVARQQTWEATRSAVQPPAVDGFMPYVMQAGDMFYSIMLSSPFNYSVETINALIPAFLRLNPTITRIDQLPAPGTVIIIPIVRLDPLMMTATAIIAGATQTAMPIHISPTPTCADCAQMAGGMPTATPIPANTTEVTIPRSRIASLPSVVQVGSAVDLFSAVFWVDVENTAAAQSGTVTPAPLVVPAARGAVVITVDEEGITVAVTRDEAGVLNWLIDAQVPVTVLPVD